MKKILFLGVLFAVFSVFSNQAYAASNPNAYSTVSTINSSDWQTLLNGNGANVKKFAVQDSAPVVPSNFKLLSGSGTFNINGLDVSINLYCNDGCKGHQAKIQADAAAFAQAQFVGAGTLEPKPDCANSFYLVTVNCPSNETVDPTTNTCSCPTGQHYVASGNDGNKWVAWGANGHIYLAPYPVPSYTYSGLTFYVYDPVRQIKSVKVADFEANPENYINHATPVPVEKKSGGRFVFNVALLASENSTTQARVIDNLKSNIGNPYLCTSNAIGAKPCHSNNDGVLTPAFSYTSGGQMYGANTDSDGSVGYGKTSTIGVFSDAVAGGACVLDDSNLCPDGSSPVDGNCPNSDTQICPDGSVISSTDTCPGGDTQTCPDGSVISISDTCPTPQSCDTSSDCTDGKTCQDTICSFPPNTPDTDPTKNSNGSKKGSVVLDSLKVVPNTINPADGTTANPGNCNLVWVVSQHDSGSVCTLYGGGLDSSNPIDLDKGIVTSGVTTGTITDSGIKNETTYHVTCDETSTDPITKSVTVTASSTKYATCNINAGFVETNH